MTANSGRTGWTNEFRIPVNFESEAIDLDQLELYV